MSNFDNEAQELLKATLINGIALIVYYAFIYFVLKKLISDAKVRAIIVGILTPFFFYYSVGFLSHPFAILLYVLKIDSIGIIGGLLFGLAKPLSLIFGVLVALHIINKK